MLRQATTLLREVELSPKEQRRSRLAKTLLRGRERQFPSVLTQPVTSCAPPLSTQDIVWSRATLSAPDIAEPEQDVIPILFAEQVGQSAPTRPAVVLLHGTGACGESCAERAADLARRGMLVVMPDSRHHGKRADLYVCRDLPWDNVQYQNALVQAWEADGRVRPFAYDTAADMFFLADYLESRPDVSVLAITGISLGGIHAWFAAAADTRWEVIAPLIGVQNFSYAAVNNCASARVSTIPKVFERAARAMEAADGRYRKPCSEEVVRDVWGRICPGLVDGDFDASHTLSLIAPRRLFVGNGRDDPRCPVAGLESVLEALTHEYRDISRRTRTPIEDLLVFKFYSCAHEVSEEMWKDCVDFIANSVAKLQGERISMSFGST